MSETNMESIGAMLTDEQVEAYLANHPDFFYRHQTLLRELKIPHETGQAVSLIERQVGLLREQNHDLEQRIKRLMRRAEENQMIAAKVHHLFMQLLVVNAFEDIIRVLLVGVPKVFSLDAVGLKFYAKYMGATPLSDQHQAMFLTDLPAIAENPSFDKPTCQRLPAATLNLLFGDAAYRVQSSVVVPIDYGWLALGSKDAERFYHSMDTLFLEYLAEGISRRLHSYLQAY